MARLRNQIRAALMTEAIEDEMPIDEVIARGAHIDELAGFVTIARAAELLDMRQAAVARLAREGVLEHRRWGRDANSPYMISRASVDARLEWLSERAARGLQRAGRKRRTGGD